jgi:CRP/FNR family transcriptional regulator
MPTVMRDEFRTDIWEAFRACPLWAETSDEILARLILASRIKECKRGEILFCEGDRTDYFVVTIGGHLRSVHVNTDGRRLTLHTAWPGDIIGAILAVSDEVYHTDIEAAERSTVAIVPARALKDMLYADPGVALTFLAAYAKRFVNLSDAVKTMNSDVPSRVARHLVHLMEQLDNQSTAPIPTVNLRVSRAELASELGTVPETLSRAFARLRIEGFIDDDGMTVRVLDKDGLVAMALGK